MIYRVVDSRHLFCDVGVFNARLHTVTQLPRVRLLGTSSLPVSPTCVQSHHRPTARPVHRHGPDRRWLGQLSVIVGGRGARGGGWGIGQSTLLRPPRVGPSAGNVRHATRWRRSRVSDARSTTRSRLLARIHKFVGFLASGYIIRTMFAIVAGIFKPPLATARAALRDGPVHLCVRPFVRSFVAKSRAKTRFSQKLSNLELWSLLMTNRKWYMGFSKNPLLDP